jgi:mannose-6-phosphate isomerase-like protein (cupin superfamily)
MERSLPTTLVHRIFPGSADFENLSRFRTEQSAEANSFDFSRVVVNKPWGYEYLWFQNSSVAVWMLHIAEGHSTSMHCHARKRTSLIVLQGEVECSTFENRYVLGAGGAVVLEPCVFHATRSKTPSFVLEVETPPLKGDLLRYRDDFGRAGRGYEAAKQYSTDFSQYNYCPLIMVDGQAKPMTFGGLSLEYCSARTTGDLLDAHKTGGLIVPFLGRLLFDRELIADIGEAVAANEIPMESCPNSFAPVEMLRIHSLSQLPA